VVGATLLGGAVLLVLRSWRALAPDAPGAAVEAQT